MNVKELIAILADLPDDMDVRVEYDDWFAEEIRELKITPIRENLIILDDWDYSNDGGKPEPDASALIIYHG